MVALVPLAICAIYATGRFGSVGPWVPIWGIATLLLSPAAIYAPVSETLTRGWSKLLMGLLAIPLSVLFAVLAANALMLFSHLFGIYDYAQM